MSQGSNTMLYVATVTVSLTSIMNGLFFTWTSPMLPVLLSKDSPVPLTLDQSTWVSSFLALGLLFSALPTGILAPRIGAKRILICSVAPCLLSTQMAAAATSFWWLLTSRLLAGVYLGMSMTMAPGYVTDMSGNHNRGFLGLISHVFHNIGCLLTYCVGPYVEYRLYQLLCSVVPIVFLVLFIWMPESPYYLLLTGRRAEAAICLATLRGQSDPTAVESELQQMELNIGEKNEKGRFGDLFSTKGNRRALANLMFLISMMLLCGHGVIMSYVGMIFKISGNDKRPEISSMILGAVQLVSSLGATFVVEKFGRRPLIILSTIGMAVALVAESVFFILKDQGYECIAELSWVPLTFLILFVIMYSIGLGALPMIIISELFPIKIKGLALSLGALFGCVLSFVFTELFLVMAVNFGIQSSFLISSGSCIIGAIFFVFYLPETKGKSLGEILRILNGERESMISSKLACPYFSTADNDCENPESYQKEEKNVTKL